MAVIRIPNTLRPLADGRSEVVVEGNDVDGVLTALDSLHPGFTERLRTDDGGLRGFVNVFVGETECRQLDGLATATDGHTVVTIVPAVAGG